MVTELSSGREIWSGIRSSVRFVAVFALGARFLVF